MPAIEVFSPSDPTTPSKIEHLVEEGYDVGKNELIYHYNFLRYEFDHPAGVLWARSYLYRPEQVSIYPPQGVSLDDAIVQKAIGYLRRRYREIQKLGANGYEPI